MKTVAIISKSPAIQEWIKETSEFAKSIKIKRKENWGRLHEILVAEGGLPEGSKEEEYNIQIKDEYDIVLAEKMDEAKTLPASLIDAIRDAIAK